MSLWLISLNLKGIEGLLLGESRCYINKSQSHGDGEAGGEHTTWRASLAT